jgi:hypothetical protein
MGRITTKYRIHPESHQKLMRGTTVEAVVFGSQKIKIPMLCKQDLEETIDGKNKGYTLIGAAVSENELIWCIADCIDCEDCCRNWQ